MEKKQHKGLTVTFWIVATILGIHYLFIYLPHAANNGTLNFPSFIGSLIIPAIILSVIWLIKKNAEKKLNNSAQTKQEDNDNKIASKNSNDLSQEKSLEDFGKNFTEEQKAIIIWFLVKIANSDGDSNSKEKDQLSQIATLLDYDSSRAETQAVVPIVAEYTSSKIKEVISFLDESLRKWFVVTAYSLIMCDGVAKEEEINSFEYYCSIFGFSEEEQGEIIKRHLTLCKHFGY